MAVRANFAGYSMHMLKFIATVCGAADGAYFLKSSRVYMNVIAAKYSMCCFLK